MSAAHEDNHPSQAESTLQVLSAQVDELADLQQRYESLTSALLPEVQGHSDLKIRAALGASIRVEARGIYGLRKKELSVRTPLEEIFSRLTNFEDKVAAPDEPVVHLRPDIYSSEREDKVLMDGTITYSLSSPPRHPDASQQVLATAESQPQWPLLATHIPLNAYMSREEVLVGIEKGVSLSRQLIVGSEAVAAFIELSTTKAEQLSSDEQTKHEAIQRLYKLAGFYGFIATKYGNVLGQIPFLATVFEDRRDLLEKVAIRDLRWRLVHIIADDGPSRIITTGERKSHTDQLIHAAIPAANVIGIADLVPKVIDDIDKPIVKLAQSVGSTVELKDPFQSIYDGLSPTEEIRRENLRKLINVAG